MHLLQKISSNTKRDLYINVARVKQDENGHLIFSVARPCLHCRKMLNHIAKYRKKKYGQRLYIRYTIESGYFTQWTTVDKLPESRMSTGWRLKYNK